MERITSFSVDHTQLKKGVYISRVDGELTTFDIRMCEPNVCLLYTSYNYSWKSK